MYRILVVLGFFAAIFIFVSCSAETQPVPIHTIPACSSSASRIYTGNFYPEMRGEDVRKAVNEIYSYATQNPPIARREALKLLAYETERWSNIQYIDFEPQPKMRVIITFLSPGLIRAIVLNHLLSNLSIGSVADLESMTQDSLAILDKREEFAFLILIQPQQSPESVAFSIAPADIQLHTTDGAQIKTTHSDDYLNEMQDTSKDKAGLFFYPAKVMRNGECDQLLRPGMETSLMFKIDNATFGANQNIKIKWVLQFPLLYNLIQPMLRLDFGNQQPGLDGYISPFPAPTPAGYNELDDRIAWGDLAQFIWRRTVGVGVPLQP